MDYRRQWAITAKLLGYTVCEEEDHDGYMVHHICGPNGGWLASGYDLTHIAVVRDIEERFGLKWNNQPYLNEKNKA